MRLILGTGCLHHFYTLIAGSVFIDDISSRMPETCSLFSETFATGDRTVLEMHSMSTVELEVFHPTAVWKSAGYTLSATSADQEQRVGRSLKSLLDKVEIGLNLAAGV